jgi:hypothetical protein
MSFARYTPQSPTQRYSDRMDRTAATMEAVRRAKKPSVSMEGGTRGARPKVVRAQGGKAEAAHKTKLAGLGCMVCRRLFPFLAPGPVQLHHLRADGWGKGDYLTLIPLCPEHHTGDTGVHGLGTKGFAKHYGFDQAELLMDALTLAKGVA